MNRDEQALPKDFRFTPPSPDAKLDPMQSKEGLPKEYKFNAPQQVTTQPEVGDEDLVTSLAGALEDTYVMTGDISRMFLQGITLNTYNDGKAWTMSKLMDAGAMDKPEGAQSLSGEELYKHILRGEQQATQAGRERSPYVTAGAEVAGSLLTPNPAGKLQAATSALGAGFRATKAAVEGGTAGYFAEDVDKRTASDAVVGAGLGLGFQGAFEGLGWMVNKATSRKIEQDLVDIETGDFTPITLAANADNKTENPLRAFYAELVAPSFGAQRVMREQEEKVIAPYRLREFIINEEVKKVMPQAERTIKELEVKHKKAIAEYTKRRGELLNAPPAEKQAAMESLDLDFSKQLRDLSHRSEQAVRSAEDTFRMATMTASLPVNMDRAFGQALDAAPNPNTALALIDNQWANNGFSMVNNRAFQIRKSSFDPDSFAEDLKGFAPDIRERMTPLIKLANSELESIVNNGWVKGQDLTKLRTMFRQRINSLGDEGQDASTKAAYSVVADRIEKTIRGQLKGKQLESYMDELKSYKTYTVFKNAVEQKSKKTGQHGAFSADDWMFALGRVSKRDRQQGEGLFRGEAESLGRLLNREKEAQDIAADNVGKELTRQQAKEKAREKATLERLKAQTKDRIARLKARQASQRDVIGIAAEERKLNELEPKLKQATQEYAELKGKALDNKVNWFKSMVTTGMLGSGTGAMLGAATGQPVLGGVAGLALGMSTATKLASPTAQRLAAGQTAPQQAVQSFLQQEMPSSVQNIAKTRQEALQYASPVIARILSQEVAN